MLQKIQSLAAMPGRIETKMRHVLTQFVMGQTVFFFFVLAVGFGAAGIFLWLSTEWPVHFAALWTAGIFIVAALAVLSGMRLLNASKADTIVEQQNPAVDIEHDIQAAAAEIAGQAVAETRRRPFGMVAVALAAGVVAGLFGAKKRD